MTSGELDAYRQQLKQRAQHVSEQLTAVGKWCEPVAPNEAVGRLSRQDAIQDQQMALAQRKELQLQQTRIKTALQRVDAGTFGLCVMCKQPIDPRRLELMPESPLCVPCLEKRNQSKR